MDTFTKAVAKGIMTLDSATTCLRMEQKRLNDSGIKDSGAGLVVMKWVVSNGWADDLSFLTNKNFTGIFMYFLVAEGLQDVMVRILSFPSIFSGLFILEILALPLANRNL